MDKQGKQKRRDIAKWAGPNAEVKKKLGAAEERTAGEGADVRKNCRGMKRRMVERESSIGSGGARNRMAAQECEARPIRKGTRIHLNCVAK